MAFQWANSLESFRNDDGDANENGKKAIDVTRDDSQRRFLAQHSVATLLRHCFEWLQHCSNIATLCCAKNRRCESSRVTSPILSKTTTLHVHHAFLCISLLSLHGYNVKTPNFTFMDDVKKHRSPKKSTLVSREIRLHLTFSGVHYPQRSSLARLPSICLVLS